MRTGFMKFAEVADDKAITLDSLVIQSRLSGVHLKKDDSSLLNQFSVATWVPKKR
jgi:hypothetical protein